MMDDTEPLWPFPGLHTVFRTSVTLPSSTDVVFTAPLSPPIPSPFILQPSTAPSLQGRPQSSPAPERPQSSPAPERSQCCPGEDVQSAGSATMTASTTMATTAGTSLRAASMERLIQLCVEAFTDGSLDKKQEEYVTVFFLVHQWLMTSQELAQALIDLYQRCDETVTCTMADCQHQPINATCTVQNFKKSICHVIRWEPSLEFHISDPGSRVHDKNYFTPAVCPMYLYWVCNFPLHFNEDTGVAAVVERLKSVLQAEGNYKLKDLVDVSSVPTYDWMRKMSIRTTANLKHPRKVSLVFKHLEPKELASHLTYLEYKAFRRVQISDYKNYAETAYLKDQPKLERSIALFNGLSQWVQCMVLSKTTPQQRADVMCKFIDVSKHLRDMQNFNTLMAIVGGLSHSALARLSKTVACLPHESQKTLMDLTELLTTNNNFTSYRKVYHQCSGFKIPILGVHLKDLIALHTALPDRVEGDLINFRKMAQLSIILKELTRLQSHDSCPVDTNMDLVNTLRLSLDLYHTEDEIYELSLAREPRGSSSSPTTPTKSVVFADWLSGVSPPDPNTINKHVRDMVESVFKNYDYDRDGLISHEEFESITGNFPFIDSFCVLDSDKDGMISKLEMETYFIRANSHALRNSFKHAFHEITYFKPTFCIHCAGLLWGLIKQGWKCKDCGINAHKHCKDLVVMECRSKKRTESISNDMEPDDSTDVVKWKSSPRDQKRTSPSSSCQQSTQTDRFVLRRASSLTILSSSSSSTTHIHQNCTSVDGEFYEEQALMCEHLLKAEEVCEKLREENSLLKSKLAMDNEQISLLKSEIGVVRQRTAAFILDQMDALHIQSNSKV